jgi:hypothetical protein
MAVGFHVPTGPSVNSIILNYVLNKGTIRTAPLVREPSSVSS